MNENSEVFPLKDPTDDVTQLTQRVLRAAYLSTVSVDYDTGIFKFAGKTQINDLFLLFSVEIDKSNGKAKCQINSENTVLNSVLLKYLNKAILAEDQQTQ